MKLLQYFWVQLTICWSITFPEIFSPGVADTNTLVYRPCVSLGLICQYHSVTAYEVLHTGWVCRYPAAHISSSSPGSFCHQPQMEIFCSAQDLYDELFNCSPCGHWGWKDKTCGYVSESSAFKVSYIHTFTQYLQNFRNAWSIIYFICVQTSQTIHKLHKSI